MSQVLLLLLSLALGVLGGVFLRNLKMRQPTVRILRAAEAIARGDTSARALVRNGPLSEVARAFDEMASRIEESKATQAELERLVATDRLTGVGNRRAFDQLAELEVAKS